MAEKLLLKERVDGIDFADVIKTKEELGLMEETDWTAQPLTLRDDEVSLVEADPEEREIFSHENDDPEDYELIGQGITVVGSFIKASFEQLVEILGGSKDGTGTAARYLLPSKKLMLTKAIRFRLKSGAKIIIPCAKGSVQFSANISANDGIVKYPFRFRPLAQPGFDAALVIE